MDTNINVLCLWRRLCAAQIWTLVLIQILYKDISLSGLLPYHHDECRLRILLAKLKLFFEE